MSTTKLESRRDEKCYDYSDAQNNTLKVALRKIMMIRR